MSSVCAEHHHHSHPLFSTTNTLQGITLPPRKLLSCRSSIEDHKALQRKLISCYGNINNRDNGHHQEEEEEEKQKGEEEEEEEEEIDPFSTDEFRMYEFKVRRCMRSRSHDWTDCPFAHPGEKARRRDPRRFHYSGNACVDFRRGSCVRGDACEFAHGVFECWLHPARYRTHACKDGENCKRKVCFFAHSPRELRILPFSSSSSVSSSSPRLVAASKHYGCCCLFCNSAVCSSKSSPTSTLMGLSHLSPPPSPTVLSPPPSPTGTINDGLRGGSYGLLSRFNEESKNSKPGLVRQAVPSQLMSYKNALLELARSLEAMEISGTSSPNNNNNTPGSAIGNLSWGCDQEYDQLQFALSPCSPSKASSAGPRDHMFNEDVLGNNGSGQFPDLDWVNELVM